MDAIVRLEPFDHSADAGARREAAVALGPPVKLAECKTRGEVVAKVTHALALLGTPASTIGNIIGAPNGQAEVLGADFPPLGGASLPEIPVELWHEDQLSSLGAFLRCTTSLAAAETTGLAIHHTSPATLAAIARLDEGEDADLGAGRVAAARDLQSTFDATAAAVDTPEGLDELLRTAAEMGTPSRGTPTTGGVPTSPATHLCQKDVDHAFAMLAVLTEHAGQRASDAGTSAKLEAARLAAEHAQAALRQARARDAESQVEQGAPHAWMTPTIQATRAGSGAGKARAAAFARRAGEDSRTERGAATPSAKAASEARQLKRAQLGQLAWYFASYRAVTDAAYGEEGAAAVLTIAEDMPPAVLDAVTLAIANQQMLVAVVGRALREHAPNSYQAKALAADLADPSRLDARLADNVRADRVRLRPARLAQLLRIVPVGQLLLAAVLLMHKGSRHNGTEELLRAAAGIDLVDPLTGEVDLAPCHDMLMRLRAVTTEGTPFNADAVYRALTDTAGPLATARGRPFDLLTDNHKNAFDILADNALQGVRGEGDHHPASELVGLLQRLDTLADQQASGRDARNVSRPRPPGLAMLAASVPSSTSAPTVDDGYGWDAWDNDDEGAVYVARGACNLTAGCAGPLLDPRFGVVCTACYKTHEESWICAQCFLPNRTNKAKCYNAGKGSWVGCPGLQENAFKGSRSDPKVVQATRMFVDQLHDEKADRLASGGGKGADTMVTGPDQRGAGTRGTAADQRGGRNGGGKSGKGWQQGKGGGSGGKGKGRGSH
jgi:hypothetical protein